MTVETTIENANTYRYFLHLAYNGARYCGWQSQRGVATVQQTLEEALGHLLRRQVSIVGCGRTDTGVHASDFYAHFELEEELSSGQILTLVGKLNSFLPTDIRIFRLFPVEDDMHARFSAVSRTYQYHVSQERQPFMAGLFHKIFFTPDLEAMNRGAQILMQYEDFTSFAKLHSQVNNNLCHLFEAHWDRKGEEYIFTIKANRFLRNMVRAITGTLLDMGRGKLSEEGLHRIVQTKDRCAASSSAPAQALFLTRVEYPEGFDSKDLLFKNPNQ